MADIRYPVDIALVLPVNIAPLVDDTDFKTFEDSIVYNAAGMDLLWNFVYLNGAIARVPVVPGAAATTYEWNNQGDGMYAIEIPASGGATWNNDSEGFGWFTGKATGVAPWRGPVLEFGGGIGDIVLARGVAGIEAAAEQHSLASIILATFKSTLAGTTWTINKLAGGTHMTKTVTKDPTADPLTGVS